MSFYNVGFVQPKVLRNGVDCSGCVLESYLDGNYVVNVSGFRDYGVVESFVGGDDSGGGGGGGLPTVLSAECIEQWACSLGGECSGWMQVRTCSEINECGTSERKPDVTRECRLGIEDEQTAESEEQVAQPLLKILNRNTLVTTGGVLGVAVILVVVILVVMGFRVDGKLKKKVALQESAAKQWANRETSQGLR